jgi:hypothetical protein
LLLIPSHYHIDDAGVAWRVVDNEAVLLHADSSEYFGLNQTGTRLWAHLADHSSTIDQLTEWARTSFSDTPPDLAAQVSGFVDELLEHKLIETGDADPTTAEPATAEEELGEVPPWEAPTVQRFGELEKLILSGE